MTVVLREEHATGPLGVPPRISRRTVVAALSFAVVGACVFAMLVSFWGLGAHHGVARFVARVVPIPAAVVDGRVVWYREVVERANALEILSNVPATESMDHALLLAERYAIVRNLADDLGVEWTGHVAAASPVSHALAGLVDSAGWTGRDKIRYYVGAYVREGLVEEAALENTELQALARARLESVQLKYQQGIGFADLAGEYGEGGAVLTAGDIGYVDPESLPEELRTVAKSIATGEVSAITETQYAFWLVKAEDVVENEDGTRSVWLRVIEVKKDLIGDIVDEQMKSARIREFLR